MSIALALIDVDSTRRKIKRTYQATLSGTYTGSGEVLDFSAATNPNLLPVQAIGYGALIGDQILAILTQGNGYVYRVAKGTTFNNGVLRVYESGADGGDLDEISGSIPAAVTGDTNILIEVTMPTGF